MLPATPHRLQHLDAIRGLAALSVCLCHFKHAFAPAVATLFSPLGDYGVFVFFVLSGFIIPRVLRKEGYRLANAGRFLLKRIVRLHPPYLVSLALTLALSIAAAAWKHEATTWSAVDLVSYFFYAEAPAENPVYWTLRVEICFYIFLALAYPLLNSSNRIVRTLAFLAPCVVWFFLADILFIHFIAFFLAGMALEQVQCGWIDWTEFSAKLLLASALAWAQTGLDGMGIALASVALISVPLRVQIPRVILWFGAISYSLYLVHFPIGVKLLNLSLGRVPQVPSELFALAALVASVLAAWGMYALVERPAMALSRSIGNGNTKLAPIA
ncbi:acyltransferase family protein [Variovorax boronicumulans]|uniref:acyltransferase family protein n=1 Tax=Variovorax boronicumulans TaxID=436515 RepID=UPI001C578A7E